MNSFKFKDKKIIIYAAGAIGSVVQKYLNEMDYEIYAFIDRGAASIIERQGIPVYTLDCLPQEVFENSNEFAVIITPKNVYEHDEIASTLLKAGLRNLIYKPKAVIYNTADPVRRKVGRAYDLLISGHIPDYDIPILENISSISDNETNWLIKQDDAYIHTWIPSFQLFTNISDRTIWSDINITTHFPLVELYRSFRGDPFLDAQESVKNYLDYSIYGGKLIDIKITDAWKENAIKGRWHIYKEMSRLLVWNKNFFTQNLPDVKLMSPNHFNMISSGKNRMAFLVAHDYSWLPVRMSRADYDEWKDYNNETGKKLKSNSKLKYSIPCVSYYDYPTKYYDYSKIWLQKVGIFLQKHAYFDYLILFPSNIKILNQMQDDGVTEQYIGSLGFNICNDFTETESYYGGFFNNVQAALHVLDHIEKYIFILTNESTTLLDDKKIFRKRKLLSVFWDGEYTDGYVFERNAQ